MLKRLWQWIDYRPTFLILLGVIEPKNRQA
jgi:hypothetical protein